MIKFLKNNDWYLNGAIILLAIASFVILYSIRAEFFWKQAIWFIVAIVVVFWFSRVDWRPLVNYRWIIFSVYATTILLLVITLIVAPTIRNARSWIIFGPFNIQTSEFAKVALIILLSYFLAKRHVGIANWKVLMTTLAYFLLPAILILRQPDLGTFLILLGIWIGFLLVSGIRWRHLIIGF